MKPNHFLALILLSFAASAAMLPSIKAASATDLKNPTAIAVDQSGNLFVADSTTQTIFKIAADGNRNVFATGVQLSLGSGLAFDSAGNLLVLNPSGEFHVGGKVLKFAPDGTKSTFATEAGLPYSIAIDSTGNVFVSDWDTGEIFKFAANGAKSTFATVGEVGSALAIDRAGNLFVADRLNGVILKFDSNGKSASFATGIRADGLAVDPSGNVFAADIEKEIFKFAPDGKRSEFARLGSPAKALAFDSAGNLFVASQETGEIEKFTPDGAKTVLLNGQSAPAPQQAEPDEDTSTGLPPKYAKDYLIAASTLSPDRKFAVIYPTKDPEESPGGANYVVALKPFAILTKLETKRPYFKNESHGGLDANWSDDNSVAMVTLGSKWGPGDLFLIELKDGKLKRVTNLLAKAHDLLLPDYQDAKAGRYNDYYDFIFETEDAPDFQLDGSKAVRINARATTDPKGASDGPVWDGRLEAVWDIPQAKFTSQKVTREFAGVRKDEEE